MFRYKLTDGYRQLCTLYRGVFAVLLVACTSLFISEHYSGPVMLYALLLGMAFHFLYADEECKPGIEYASTTILRLGIVLLGVRISFSHIFSLGWEPIVVLLVSISSVIILGYIASSYLGVSKSMGVLTGGAVGICGVSAAMAIAAVLPKTKETERNVLLTVAVITAVSTIAMIVYPMIVSFLSFSDTQAALFLGATIHDVAQVLGAGYILSDSIGESALLIKLIRVSLLSPVVLGIGALLSYKQRSQSKAVMTVPLFLVLFVVVIICHSLGVIPQSIHTPLQQISRFAIIMSIAGLGMKTSLQELSRSGWRPLVLIVGETLWLVITVLGMLYWMA